MVNACIDDWIALNRSQTQFVQQLTQGLSSEAMHWNPKPGSWSIAQCLDHLNRTTSLYGPEIEKSINQRKPPKSDYKRGWKGSKLIAFVGPDYQGALKAPKSFKPLEQPETDGVADFLQLQDWSMERMMAARSVDLNKSKLRSPALRLLSMKLGVAFELLGHHAQRHLNQAQRVRESEGFPAPKPSAPNA